VGGNETLLVLEDEAELRAVITETLGRAGYRVLEADGLEAALGVCERTKGPIHLVISDVVMPGGTGPAAAAAIAKVHPTARLLLMSGYTDGLISSAPGMAADTAFLAKPFSSQALLRKVRAVLDARPAPPDA
jgi:DNA-binding NtrC family response regulator